MTAFIKELLRQDSSCLARLLHHQIDRHNGPGGVVRLGARSMKSVSGLRVMMWTRCLPRSRVEVELSALTTPRWEPLRSLRA